MKTIVFEDVNCLQKLFQEDCRPSHCEEGSDPETWMNKDQKNEHDKAVIGVVTSKIEVTQLSKKISEALVEAGLIPPTSQSSLGGPHSTTLHHHQGPPSGSEGGGAGPSSSRDTTFNSSGQGGPPDHYYDYSFLG
uniref:Uncharacterized protein n=1 Tax=Caenorhabditis japonica TaxID=281687 RepID=A0A8R1ITL7_CAEJA